MEKGVVNIGNRPVGEGYRVFVVAEIGVNHNGSLEIAKKLIEAAANAGADAVKFQKRTPDLCVPRDQWNVERDTPWGRMKYIDYRYKVEFGMREYSEIDRTCRSLHIQWFASCWDERSIDFMEAFDPPCYKVASASLTDTGLLLKKRSTGRPMMISTGMSTMEEIESAVATVGTKDLLIAHTTSTYPCAVEELNLRMIQTLKGKYPDCPIGYSGHEVGLMPTIAAVALGATFVERHITLDRAMWGSDQAASVEPHGFKHLIEGIRDIEKSLGDGVKRVYDGEMTQRKKLRRAGSTQRS